MTMFMCLSKNLCGCTLVRNWVLRPKTGDIFTWLGRVPLSSSFLKIYRVNVYQAFDIFLVLSCTLQKNVHGLPFNGFKNSAGQNKCMKHIVKLIVVWVLSGRYMTDPKNARNYSFSNLQTWNFGIGHIFMGLACCSLQMWILVIF